MKKIELTIAEVFEPWSFKAKDTGDQITLYPFEVKEINAINGHHGYEFNSSKPIPAGSKKAKAELVPTGSNQFSLRNWEFE